MRHGSLNPLFQPLTSNPQIRLEARTLNRLNNSITPLHPPDHTSYQTGWGVRLSAEFGRGGGVRVLGFAPRRGRRVHPQPPTGFGFHVSGFMFRVSGFGFWVWASYFGFLVLVFNSRVLRVEEEVEFRFATHRDEDVAYPPDPQPSPRQNVGAGQFIQNCLRRQF